MKRWAPVLVAVALVAIACSSGSDSSSPQTINPSESHAPVTLSMWSEWTSAAETKVFNKIFEGFQRQYPWITVDSRTGLTDNKITAAINSGEPPDSVLSFGVDNVGLWCSTGAWIDMTPYINGPDGIDMSSTFPPSALTYTSYNGNQCSFPFLTDVTGMYYNLDMFKAAGISDPPKTTDELLEDAKKLTQFNSDGSIKVAGFVPLQNWEQLGISDIARAYGGEMLDENNQPLISSDPAWEQAFTWQKSLIDFYGYENITKFFAANTDAEFSASNAFENGKVAMMWDGEWRTAFIAREHPELKYATAPFPVGPDNTDAYGSARVGGTIVGIPENAPHADAGWLVVKFLSTDTDYLTFMANKVRNVPTTEASATSPDFQNDPNFQTFIDVWNNPESKFFPPLTASGGGYFTPLEQFTDEWQAGKKTDLKAGLQEVNDQISQALQQGEAP